MKSLSSKQYSKKQKIITMLVCAAIALAAYFVSYSIFESHMSAWQKAQTMSYQDNTGSTKFKAHIDALSIGGIAFCASAIAIIVVARTRTMHRLKSHK